MNSELWSTVREARLGAPGAVAEFVEIVFGRLGSSHSLDPVATRELFSHLARHLGPLTRYDDFDSWLKAQAKHICRPEFEGKVPEDGDLQEVARIAFREGLDSKVAMLGTRVRLGRLVYSGWLPLFLISLSFLFYVWPHGEQIWSKSTETTFVRFFWFCLLWPTLLSFVLSPILGSWRKRVARSPASATAAALLFTPGFFFLTGLLLWMGAERRLVDTFKTWSMLGTPYVLVQKWENYRYAFSFHPYLLGMSPFLLGTLIAATCMVWLAAIFTHYSFWIPMSDVRPWRLRLSKVFLMAVPAAMLAVLLSVLNCCAFDQELQAHWSRPRVPEAKSDIDTRLQEKFEADPRVRAFAQDSDRGHYVGDGKDNRLAPPVFQAWLDAGAQLWTQEKWYQDPALQPLAESYVLSLALDGAPETPGYSELEVRLRSWCARRSTSNEDTLSRLVKARLRADQWRRLEDISLQGLEHFQKRQTEDFDYAESRQFRPSDEALSLVDRLDERIIAGSRWKLYKKNRRILRKASPLTPDEFRRFADNDLNTQQPGVYSKFAQDRAGLNQALIVILCEGRRLKAEGKPCPQTMGELPAEISEHLLPYSDWIYLRKTNRVTSVGLYSYQRNGERTEMISFFL